MLNRLYYTVKLPSALSSVKKLYQYAKRENPSIKYKDVQTFLKSQTVYTIHKPVIRNFKRNKIICINLFEYSFSDLIDYSQYKSENGGFAYILCTIDGFSRYAKAHALKRKDGLSIRNALDSVFPRETPVHILTDNGREYNNKIVLNWCKENDVNLIAYADDKIKSSMAERFIRTLKSKIHKVFSTKGDHKWIDILQDVVESYNNSYHRVIKMSPVNVTPYHRKNILKNIYGVDSVLELLPKETFITHPNDRVRLVRSKATFDKSYHPTHTEETFDIVKRYPKSNYPMFSIKDKKNELIKGKFYKQEIQPVIETSDTYFRIEKILGKRTRRGIKEVKVRWLGYSPLFDSYIPEGQVANFSNLHNESGS